MDTAVGETFAGYRVLTTLGSGGMGDVYLVENTQLHRREALKVTRISSSQDAARRFSCEAGIMASFDHPSIATIFHYGIQDDLAWYSMQYLPGQDLSESESLSIAELITVANQIGDALDYAHRREVIHRDVKPANIHIRRNSTGSLRATLLDFGVARRVDITSVTHANAFVGTLTYSAPEAMGGQASHPAADQYSFACTMFEQLTGRPPYSQRTLASLVAAHSSAPIPRISSIRPELAPLDSVFLRALAKQPEERFDSCGDFSRALAAGLGHTREQQRELGRPRRLPPVPPHSGANHRRPPVVQARHPQRSTEDRQIAGMRAHGARRPGSANASADARYHLMGLAAVALTVVTAGFALLTTAGSHETDTSRQTATAKRAGTNGGGSSAVAGNSSDGLWGLVIDPGGTTYAFSDFPSQEALLASASDKWNYDPQTRGTVYFSSGCGAFVSHESPEVPGRSYQFGLGEDRASAHADARSRTKSPNEGTVTVVDTLCVGDELQ